MQTETNAVVLWTEAQQARARIMLRVKSDELFNGCIVIPELGVSIIRLNIPEASRASLSTDMLDCFFRLRPEHFALWWYLKFGNEDILADKLFFGHLPDNQLINIPALAEELKKACQGRENASVSPILLSAFGEEQQNRSTEPVVANLAPKEDVLC